MKISINSKHIINRLGIEEGFRQIANSGFDCVDFSFTFLLPIHWPYDQPQAYSEYEKMSDEELIEVIRPYKEAAEKYSLSFGQAHAVDPPFIGVPSVDSRLLEMHKRAIKLCKYLDCKYLVVHPAQCHYDFKRLSPEEEWGYNMHMFGELIPYLKEYDVIACLENLYTTHAGKYLSSICQCPHEANRYIDALNDMAGEKRFAFCLDTGHALMVGSQIDRVIHTIGHRLEVLHLNDNNGVHDEHLMPYTGIQDWSIVCDALRDIGYSNCLNFELYMRFEKEILPAALDYVASVGRFFSSQIEGQP